MGFASTLPEAEQTLVGILFKAKPRGAVWTELTSDPNVPPWVHIQTQEHGSYRSSDMLELLERTLKPAAQDSESAVVLLDWYVGRRTVEIASLISFLRHVFLFHGGGTMPFEQVNDTHLHARLQKLMKSLEAAVFYGQLADNAALGVKKAASHSRQELVALVRVIWGHLDHVAIS